MNRWLPPACLLAMTAAVAIGFAQLFADLRAQWNDVYGSLSHAYLVFAIAAFLAVRAWRGDGGPPPVRPWWPALVPLVALLALGVLAEALFMGSSRSIVLPPLLACAVALAWGRAAAARLAWPIAFCYFGLSIWNPLLPLLQRATTGVATWLVHQTGIPVYVEGNYVHLVSGVFEIASGCAGLNYFIVALTLGAVAATLYLRRWRSRLAILAASAVAGVVANWLRVSSLIVIGHVTQMQHYLIRVDHLAYGWVLFLVTFVPVVLLLRRLQGREEATPADADGGEATAEVRALPLPGHPVAPAAALILGCALLASPALLRSEASFGADDRALAPFPDLTPVGRFGSGWKPEFAAAREYRGATPDGRIEAYAAAYGRQRYGAHVFDAANEVGGHAWQRAEAHERALPEGRLVTEELGSLAGRRYVLWTWYEIGGREVADKLAFRRASLAALLAGRRDARAFALLRDCEGDCAAAAAALVPLAVGAR